MTVESTQMPITDGITLPLAMLQLAGQADTSNFGTIPFTHGPEPGIGAPLAAPNLQAPPSDIPFPIGNHVVSSPPPGSELGDIPALLTPPVSPASVPEHIEHNQAGAAADAPQPLPRWPGTTVTVSDLLMLCRRCRTEPLGTVWADLFGDEYTYSPLTAWRYVLWGQRFLEDEAAGSWAAANLDRSIAHARFNDRASFNMISNFHFSPPQAASHE